MSGTAQWSKKPLGDAPYPKLRHSCEFEELLAIFSVLWYSVGCWVNNYITEHSYEERLRERP